ncbi:MAG: hypothetical protein K9N06_08000 [Candidatus Cloacimonetes bacterium]|nr:hypothetical protein [Candidatus Cloacimonadota bacterium]
MRKYKFLFLFVIILAVFLVLSWFIYDGIDVFFELVYSPSKDKSEKVETIPQNTNARTSYVSKDEQKEVQVRDDMAAPDTRYIKTQETVQRDNAFEKFLIKIFPEQLDYILNPYTFFLILILTVLPVIGIFIYLVIYYLR